ncbi:hypothetical protein ACN083_03480 [Rothia sp. CCM 9418]|uniref:hypothetical protein n=1 Tax=Rothia sp. CCM 9418 TaxID=3402661 RepID=UPI003AEE06D7
MHNTPDFSSSRRGLFRMGALGGAVAGATVLTARSVAPAQATPTAHNFPEKFIYPAIAGPSLALWGSSSIEGARATEGVVAGYDVRLSTLLTRYLQVPVLNFGQGSETSTNILARRGAPQFTMTLKFPEDLIPAEGSVTVQQTESTAVEWNDASYYPGYIQDIPGTLQAIKGAPGSYTFTRTIAGEPRYAPATVAKASVFSSYQQMISYSSHHLVQIGRNNITELDRIKEHTQLAVDMAPERTIILGHFAVDGDGPDSGRAKAVRAYNEWGRQTYGNAFINPQEYLREVTQQPWLRYGDLNGSGVWNSKEDADDYQQGRLPRSLYATDGIHLNGWGYLALARQIQAVVTELKWFSS